MKKYFIGIIAALFFTNLNAHVNLIYPEGGEVFDPGQEVTIEWEIIIQHDTQNWDLYFSTDGGENWEDLELDIHPDTLFYVWTVPDEGSNQARIRVVQDNSGFDYEDESDDFTITEPVGIENLYPDKHFSIYPNPARDHVIIEFKKDTRIQEIEIFNSDARLLQRHRFSSENAIFNRHRIPLDGLKPGIYFLRFESGKSEKSMKFIHE